MDLIRFMKETMRAVEHDLAGRSTQIDAPRTTANNFEREFHRFVMEEALYEARNFGDDLTMYRSPQGGAWMPLSDAFLAAHAALI